MAESSQHQTLIHRIIDYLDKTHSTTYSLTIYHDLTQLLGAARPPRISGFVPDVYAFDVPATIKIVGEAKTLFDLETEHSRRQYEAFIRHLCEEMNGIFILSVPFHRVPAARRIMSNLTRRIGPQSEKVKIIILYETGEFLL